VHVHVHGACPCPWCMFMSMVHVHVHGACPRPRCMSMSTSMLQSTSTQHVHNYGAYPCPCPGGMFMSMLHVYVLIRVHGACPSPCCVCSCLCPWCMYISMIHCRGYFKNSCTIYPEFQLVRNYVCLND
jgi:hypothetical protein